MKAKLSRPFDTIYIEQSAKSYPVTQKIIDKFKSTQIIEINAYQEIFNRNRQNFRIQKLSPKLILAVKNDNFLYPGSSYTPSFNHPHFFYNAMALNCIYDCGYCYLQGMFNSGNLVIFVNQDDFYNAATEKLTELGSLYLSISYDTDLLAIEHLTGYCAKWIELCTIHPNLLIESRSKSCNFNAIKSLKPIDNFILSWTLNPEIVSKEIESGTPPLASRIRAIKEAQKNGWNVRICFDPLIIRPNWENNYQELISTVTKELDLRRIKDFSIGTFRMNDAFFKKIQKIRPSDKLFAYPYTNTNGIISYPETQDQILKSTITELLIKSGVSKEIIFYQ